MRQGKRIRRRKHREERGKERERSIHTYQSHYEDKRLD